MSYPIQFFDLRCPSGGDFFVCEGYATEFVGCCMSNPCTSDAKGKCSQQDIRTSSFSKDKYGLLPAQDCTGDASTVSWYTCGGTDPPFLGCCRHNACGGKNGSCATADLVPAKLSTDTKLRQGFLTGGGTNKTAGGSNDTPTADPSPPPSSSGSMSGKTIGGIVAGIGIAAMIIIAVVAFRWGVRVGGRRARRGGSGPQKSPDPTSTSYDMGPDGGGIRLSPYQGSSPGRGCILRKRNPYSHAATDSHHLATPKLMGPYNNSNVGSPKPSGFSQLEGHPSPETQYQFSSITAGASGASMGSVYYHHVRQASRGSPGPFISSKEMVAQPLLEMDGSSSDRMRHELSADQNEGGQNPHPSVLIPGGRTSSSRRGSLAAGGSQAVSNEMMSGGGSRGSPAPQNGNQAGGRQTEDRGNECGNSHALGIRSR